MISGPLIALFAASVLAYDVVALFAALKKKILQFGASWQQWVAELFWFSISTAGLVTWPNGLNPRHHPVESLLVFAAVAASPIIFLERSGPAARAQQMANRYCIAIALLSSVAATALTLQYLIRIRPTIEGVDFFFFVCFARDLAAGFTDVPMVRYGYFPGVYAFWRAGLTLGGGSLESLQWWFLGLLVANGALVALIVARVAGTVAAGVFAAFGYLVLCWRFEAAAGTTEPIATFPVLAGLAVWGAQPLKDRSGVLRAMSLAVGLGLAVYAKQHAGLLALGWVSLHAETVLTSNPHRHRPLHLILIPIVASVVLLIAILTEGYGLEPLRIGLNEIRHYDREGSFLENLHRVSHQAGPLVTGTSILAISTWTMILVIPQWRLLLADPPVRLLGFCVISCAAALLPFASRPYLHYALLSLPFLLISVVCTAIVLARRLPQPVRSSPLAHLLALILAIAFVASVGLAPYLNLRQNPQPVPWRLLPIVESDLTSLKVLVRPTEDLLLIPPRRNEIHFVLQTRSVSFPLGYGWYKRVSLAETLSAPELGGVITIHPSFLDPTDRIVCEMFNCREVPTLLERYGFQPVTVLRSMILWRRTL